MWRGEGGGVERVPIGQLKKPPHQKLPWLLPEIPPFVAHFGHQGFPPNL